MNPILLFTFCLLLFSCKAPTQEEASTPVNSETVETSGYKQAHLSSLPKDKMAQAYSEAIEEYLDAVYKNGALAPDTLFIGKHPEFPDITFPPKIQLSHILVITPDEAGALKNREGFVYLNIIAWFSIDAADFIIVTFKQGMHPQFNCLMNFKSIDGAEFSLDSLNFVYPYPGNPEKEGK